MEVLILRISKNIIIKTRKSNHKLSSKSSNKMNPRIITMRIADIKDTMSLWVEDLFKLCGADNVVMNIVFQITNSLPFSLCSSFFSLSSLCFFFLFLYSELFFPLFISSFIFVVDTFFVAFAL